MENSIHYPFLLSLFVILTGYVLTRLKVLSLELGKDISRLIVNVTLPAVILNTLTTMELVGSLFFFPLICIAASVIILPFAKLFFNRLSLADRGNAYLTVIGYNIGLFAYPLIEGLYGKDGLAGVAMFDVGNAFVAFGLLYLVARHFSPQEDKKITPVRILKALLYSIPFMSYVIGLSLNIAGLSFPSIIGDAIALIARANNALVLLVLGMTLRFTFPKKTAKVFARALAVRYGLGLVLGFAAFFLLPFDIFYRRILLIGLLLPAPLVIIPYAAENELDMEFAGTYANASVVISFAIMWLIASIT
ncbi:AEC family transporter [Spirochaetia bacterium 38H-sp]|uniref:AEC family transporter n=1 Tax=Rarispira pelagica TaxID=3141764 RepID=A0ABU9UAF7_9SPIR